MSLVYLDDLAAQDFLLRDGGLLVPFLAGYRAVEQLARTLAREDDEFETVLFRCSFHSVMTSAFDERCR